MRSTMTLITAPANSALHATPTYWSTPRPCRARDPQTRSHWPSSPLVLCTRPQRQPMLRSSPRRARALYELYLSFVSVLVPQACSTSSHHITLSHVFALQARLRLVIAAPATRVYHVPRSPCHPPCHPPCSHRQPPRHPPCSHRQPLHHPPCSHRQPPRHPPCSHRQPPCHPPCSHRQPPCHRRVAMRVHSTSLTIALYEFDLSVIIELFHSRLLYEPDHADDRRARTAHSHAASSTNVGLHRTRMPRACCTSSTHRLLPRPAPRAPTLQA